MATEPDIENYSVKSSFYELILDILILLLMYCVILALLLWGDHL